MKSISALPTGWIQMPLGTSGTWHGGGTPSKFNESYWTNGTIPWISPKDMKAFRITDSEDHLAQVAIEETNVKLFPSGTVLVVIRSGILSRTLPVAVSQVIGTMNQDLKGLCPADGIDSDFVAYFLQAFEQDILRKCSKHGTTVASIDTASLHSYPLFIAPLNEQRRIVAKIEELFSDLDAGVAALKRAKANLKRYRASVLKAAVEGKLTEEWRAKHPAKEPASELLARILKERRQKWEFDQLAKFAAAGKQPPKNWRDKYVEPQPPDSKGLPHLPNGWCWASVEQTSEVQGGIQKQPKRAPAANSFPFLRVANVHRNRLELDEVHRIELFGNEIERLRLQPDDLLVVEGNGSKTEIGRSAIWNGEIEDCVHQNHIIRVRFRAGSSRYLNAYWNSPSGNGRVMEQAASTSGLYTLSVTKVCELPVPLAPLEEQLQIVAEVEEKLSLIAATEKQIADDIIRAIRLRQSILKRAFEGKLVPQDPSDEPASVLLERLRAQQSIQEGARKSSPPTRSRRGRSVKSRQLEGKANE